MQNLRLYCDVAQLRSFSQAAARHDITQSAASQRVGQLERRLGVTLIDRSVRPLELTEAGREFLRGCEELIERYDQLEKRVTRLRPEPAGEVRISAIYSAGIDLLNQAQEGFEQSHPRVRVLIEYLPPEEVAQAVNQRRCDVGILSYPKQWGKFGIIPLRNERMAVVTAPGHPLAKRKTVRAGDLARWPMIGFTPELPVARSIRKYFRLHEAEPEMTSEFDNIDTIKSAVAVTGDHFAILPRRTVMREAAAGTLGVVTLDPQLTRPMGIVYHRTGSSSAPALSPAAQAFVDYMIQFAGADHDSDVNPGPKHLVGA